MEKENISTSERSKAIKMMQMSGEVIGNAATKGLEDTTVTYQSASREGTGLEESTLSSKDKVLTTLEKYEHVKAAGSYVIESHENKKEAKKRIKTTRRETICNLSATVTL